MMHSEESYLDSDRIKKNLKSKAIRGGKYALLFQGIRFPIFFLGNVILAKLLDPEHFGLIAMVSTALNFTTIFSKLGINQSVIKEDKLTDNQLSSLFWINLFSGVVICLLLIGSSGLIGDFYKEDKLVPIVISLALVFIFSSSFVVPSALLRRAMMNHLIFRVQTFTVILKFTAAIAFAYYYKSYWALVILKLADPFFSFLFTWYYCKWKPRLYYNFGEVKHMLGFGINISISNIIRYFARYSPSIFIGRVYDSVLLGYFATAYNLVLFPIFQINLPLRGVVIPVLTRVKDEVDRFRNYYLTFIRLINTVIGINIFFGIWYAQTLFPLILGDKWLNAAGVFQALGVAAILQPVINSFEWVFISIGKDRKVIQWQFFAGIITVISVVVSLPFGIYMIAISYSAFEIILKLPVGIYLLVKNSELRITDFFVSFRDLIIGVLILGGVFYITDTLFVNSLSLVWKLALMFILTNLVIASILLIQKDLRELFLRYITKKNIGK